MLHILIKWDNVEQNLNFCSQEPINFKKIYPPMDTKRKRPRKPRATSSSVPKVHQYLLYINLSVNIFEILCVFSDTSDTSNLL